MRGVRSSGWNAPRSSETTPGGGIAVATYCALIITQMRESDAALDRVERLLSQPVGLTVHDLRFDPRWDPIREHPRFKALLAKYAED